MASRTFCPLWTLAPLIAVGLLVASLPAHAGTRVALVIGNASYQNVSTLTNPANDATVIAETLRSIGFDSVEETSNLDNTAFRKALRTFATRASGADTALVYYAGHGVEVDGRNYLVPVDATLAQATDAEFEAIPLDSVRTAVSGATNLRLVILDACRNNPFKLASTDGTRAVGRGLARVEPGANEIIAYAAREGTVASDGAGANSPYATALVKHLKQPGLDVRLLFGEVRDEVIAATGRAQEPFIYGTLGGKPVYLSEPPPAPAPSESSAPAEGPATRGSQLDKQAADAWIAVKDTTSVGVLKTYIAKFKGTVFADLAAARLAEIESETQSGEQPAESAAEAPASETDVAAAPAAPAESEIAAAEPASAAAAPTEESEEIEPETLEPTVIAVGKWAEGAALADGKIWVAESGQRSLVAIGPGGRIVTRAQVGRLPVGVEAAADGTVYSLQNTDKTLWAKRPKETKGKILARMKECPQDLAIGPRAVWALILPDCSSGNARAIRIDPQSGKQAATELLGGGAETIAFAHGRAWIGHVQGGLIDRIDPKSLENSPIGIGDVSIWDLASNSSAVFAGGRIGEDNARGTVVSVGPGAGEIIAARELSGMVQRVVADDRYVVAASLEGTLNVMDADTLLIRRIITLSTGPFRPSDLLLANGTLIVIAQQLGGENGAVLVVKGWQPGPPAAAAE